MALTKVSTDGVKDDAITSGKIPANAVGASELATDSVGYSELAVNAVGNENISAGSISSGKMASDSVATAAIQDQAVTLAKLPHGTSSNDGKFLRANNGADPTFETVNTDLVSDTSPQLGGDLASNGNDILFADNDKAVFGTGADLKIYHNGSHNYFLSSNGDYVFDTGSTELARLTSSGNLGIGTASPVYKLHLNESTSGSNYITFTNSSTGTSGSDGAQVGIDGLERLIVWQAENNDIRFATNNTERMRILSGGGLTFNGDTTQANALDDYEEGTFVVGFKFSNQNFNGSLSTAQGYYTKIGRQVFVSLQLVVSDKGTNTSGGAMITGLPFTVLNADNARASGVVGYHQGTSGIDFPIQILVEQNQTQFPLRQAQATSANIDSSNLSNGFRVYITVAYFAA